MPRRCGYVEWSRRRLPLRLRALEPGLHLHLAVRRGSARQAFARLLGPTGAAIQPREAELAVGDERAHAALDGKAERAAVVALRRRPVIDVADARGDVAQQAVRPCL